MQLKAYLERINYRGVVEPTLECLTGIHRRQALSVPYENIDVQLGRPVNQDISHIFDKIVTAKRGGWCYEVNGLLQWALQEAGFDVMRGTAGVHRRERGDVVLGNHLILLVRLDRIYLADLGLGDGIREPIPLEEGCFAQGSLKFRLEKLEDGYWRFHNHGFGYPPSFDFRQEPADELLLETKCNHLQSSAESVFVQNFSCEMMAADSQTCLTGRVLRHKTSDGTRKVLLNSVDELEQTVADVFGIRGVALAPLWPKIVARHEVLFGEQPI